MSDSNKLFEVIKSLKKSEKRYFKLIGVHTQKSSSYITVFDAVEKQKQYDERKLKKQFKGISISLTLAGNFFIYSDRFILHY